MASSSSSSSSATAASSSCGGYSSSSSPAASVRVAVPYKQQHIASSSDLACSPASTASLPSLSDGSSSGSSSIASLHSTLSIRPLEHLAVLLPRDLWKPDNQASRCDAFPCDKRFSILERKHHCRKCGGIYCHACSSRTTPLLDTTTLPFLHPPHNTPLALYATAEAPLLPARVCDACYNQIHGIPRKTLPVSSSLDTTSLQPPLKASRRRRSPLSSLPPPPPTPIEVDLPPDLAELATYPLRHPSAICKATGGGRWVPVPPPDAATRRFPGRKPAYELVLEEEERAARRQRENPVITDGPFRMRKAVDRRAIAAGPSSA